MLSAGWATIPLFFFFIRTYTVLFFLFLVATALPTMPVLAQTPVAATSPAPIAVVGRPLPAWQKGYLDLHHINTGRGNAAFYIFPDGTTMLLDAGELDPSSPRTTSKRNTPIRP